MTDPQSPEGQSTPGTAEEASLSAASPADGSVAAPTPTERPASFGPLAPVLPPPSPELAEALRPGKTAAEHLPVPAGARKPGPALPEAVLWLIGLVVAQLVGTIGMTVVLLAQHAAQNGLQPTLRMMQQHGALEAFIQQNHVPLFVGIEAFVVLAAVAASLLRLGRDWPRRLGTSFLPFGHLVCILLLVFPIQVLSNGLYAWLNAAWEELVVIAPELKGLEELTSIEYVEELAAEMSLGLLVVVIAVAPAIAEELVFRGVIGRGLVARWGMPTGIALTSLLFAAAHVFPPHVLALIPLAVFIHVAYLATRSFWAPMLIHFLNNGFAAVLLKVESKIDVALLSESGPPLWAVAAAAVCVFLFGTVMWKSRVEFGVPDGPAWDPGYPTADYPPRGFVVERRRRRCPSMLIALTALTWLGFVAASAASVVRH